MQINGNKPKKRTMLFFGYLFIVMFVIGIISQPQTEIESKSDGFKLLTQVDHNIPSAAESFIENRTDYTMNLVNDSQFSHPLSSSPWSIEQSPDLADTYGELSNNQSNFQIIGNKDSLSYSANALNLTDWTIKQNPEFPAYPTWTAGINNGSDSSGLWVRHNWNEGSEQLPSMNWVRNFSTYPYNMEDYEITTASVSALINASTNSNIDLQNDMNSILQAVSYDHVTFYVRIADLARTKIYTIASYQTPKSQLNWGVGSVEPRYYLTDRYLTTVSENELKFYLSSVLSVDHYNFTIILGVDFFCEDNQGTDTDTWTLMRLKSFNFAFTYEKRIDQFSTITIEQTGFKINPSLYPGDTEIIINNASLSFTYNLSTPWPSTSQNSQIRVQVNNYYLSESIALNSTNTSIHYVKDGQGFDVKSLISVDQTLSLRIELYLADTFTLNSSIWLTIDEVNLTVGYTVIEQFSIVATSLKVVGTLARTVQWNNSFIVTLNYTEDISRIGIDDTNFIVDWLQEYSINPLGNGLYNITCQTNQTRPNQQYLLDITVPAKGLYLSQQLSIEVNIIGRLTNLNLSLNGIPQTTFPAIQVPIQDTLEIWVEYRDTGSQDSIITENKTLIGSSINSSMYEVSYNTIEEYHIFEVDTSQLGIGTHLITVSLNATNFETQSQPIQVEILRRSFEYILLINDDDYTDLAVYDAIIAESLNISLQIRDKSNTHVLSDATLQILGDINSSAYEYMYAFTYHQFQLDTVQLGLGIHLFTISITSNIYSSESFQLRLTLLPRDLEFNYRVNGTLWTDISAIPGMIEDHLNLTCWWMDELAQQLVDSPNISIFGISSESYEISSTAHEVTIIINTGELTIGNHYFTIQFNSPLYAEFSFNFQLILTERIIVFNITRNGENYNQQNAFEVPITEVLTFRIQLIENATQENFIFNESMITISGIASTYYSTSYHDGYLELTLNTTNLGLGINLIGFSVEILNYKPISHSYLLTVAQIQTQMQTVTQELSFSVVVDDDFLCKIYIQDIDFDVNLTECVVSYNWQFGSGTLEYNEEEGVYQFPFSTKESGVYSITITAYNGPYYKIDPIEITLNVNQPISPTGLPTWILYIFGTIVGGFVISFIAYQRYFKFPPSIRKIHQLKSLIRKGKSSNLNLPSEKDLFSEAYHSIIRETVSIPR